MSYEYVDGVFGGQALRLEPLQKLKTEKQNLQAVVLYVKPNDSTSDFEHVYIYKTGAYIGGQDVVEVSIVGIAGEIPPEKEWVHDVATFDGDIVYINGGYTIDELLLLDYLPDIVDIEAWHFVPMYDPEEVNYQYTLIEQTEEKIALVAEDVQDVKLDMAKLEIKATGIESTVSTMQQHNSIIKPEGGKLWHFDISLDSTEGEEPLTSENVELNDKGKFGGSVKLMQGSSLVYDIPPSSSLTIGMYIKKGEW